MVEPNAHVLVINVARIGDTLLVTPALLALKEACPEGRLVCLAHPKRCEVLANLPFLDRVAPITKGRAWLRGLLPGRTWDYALVYGSDLALIRYALRVARRVVAFEQQSADLNRRLWRAVRRPPAPLHAVHERLLLLEPLGTSARSHRLAYQVTAAEADAARAWFARSVPPAAALRVGVHLSSFPTKAYRDWPVENFIELGRKIFDYRPGAHLIILGGPEDREKAGTVARALAPAATDAAGCFGLRESAALMAQLDLYVGVDTGPTHVAGALGIPVVAIYHCYHRGRFLAPLDHPALYVVEHPAPDSRCGPDTPMSELTVEAVWAQVQAALEATGRRTRAAGAGMQ